MRVVLYRPHLRKTVTIALVVGTVLFSINQLDVVVRGDAGPLVWVKSARHLPGAVLRLERRCARGQSPAASLTGLAVTTGLPMSLRAPSGHDVDGPIVRTERPAREHGGRP